VRQKRWVRVRCCRVFAARRCASAVLAMALCPSVCPSITSFSLVISECSLSGRGQGHASNFYIVDLENFATASRRYTGDIHNSTVVDLFMTPIRQWKRLGRVTVECTCLLHIGPPKPHNFMTSISSGLVVQVVSTLLCGNWQDFNWHDALRGPSAIAELLATSMVIGTTSRTAGRKLVKHLKYTKWRGQSAH